jgi:hypothetical protein
MPYICKLGGIQSKNVRKFNIPQSVIKKVKIFLDATEYKGSIILPNGPYDSETATHVSRSFELLEKSGDFEEIKSIIIKKEKLSVKLKPHIISDKPITLDDNLKKIISRSVLAL